MLNHVNTTCPGGCEHPGILAEAWTQARQLGLHPGWTDRDDASDLTPAAWDGLLAVFRAWLKAEDAGRGLPDRRRGGPTRAQRRENVERARADGRAGAAC